MMTWRIICGDAIASLRTLPERFEEMAMIEEMIGPTSYLMRDRETGVRIPLRQLDPNVGRHDEPEISCGFACERVRDEIELRPPTGTLAQ